MAFKRSGVRSPYSPSKDKKTGYRRPFSFALRIDLGATTINFQTEKHKNLSFSCLGNPFPGTIGIPEKKEVRPLGTEHSFLRESPDSLKTTTSDSDALHEK